ncbi:MAG: SGNH/GDSL hydrolase family protein [Sandaracinaceae bacterium]
MRRLLLAVLLALTPAVAAAQRAAEPAAPRVFVVGDSHVRMLGPSLLRRLETFGAEPAGFESRVGWSTRRYRREGDLGALLEANGRPEIVVVSLGGNDVVADEARYAEDLTWVVEQARGAGAQTILWLGPATSDADRSERAERTGERHEANAELQAELLPPMGVRWIDSRPLTESHHRRDGVHFTRTGYRLWAVAALPAVQAACEGCEDESASADAGEPSGDHHAALDASRMFDSIEDDELPLGVA